MSKTKKPRNKKFNRIKFLSSALSLKFHNALVGWCNGNNANVLFERDGKRKVYTAADAKGLSTLPFQWSILCCVMCRDQTGQQYIAADLITTPAKYPYQSMCDFLNSHHQALISKQNSLHVCCTGWIASPVGHDISMSLADTIMTELGAWDHLAQWEQEKLDIVEGNTNGPEPEPETAP